MVVTVLLLLSHVDLGDGSSSQPRSPCFLSWRLMAAVQHNVATPMTDSNLIHLLVRFELSLVL